MAKGTVTYDFSGKTAVVTGGAMGIGEAAVRRFAEAGASVAIADIDADKGKQLEEQLRSQGCRVRFLKTDVGSESDVKQLMDEAVGWTGRIDAVYNNAGVAIPGDVATMSEEDWQRVLNINLGGVFRGCKFSLPHMEKQGSGAIVNCSSTQAIHGFHGWAGYAATKGGILAMTRQIAIDYASKGIRVNAVSPGTIMTPMNEKIFEEVEDPQALIDTWNRAHPVGRFGQPSEVADLVMYLCSDAAAFITGQTFVIDGGQTIRGE
ncbi:SDR family NAD(P)-dependent oxidoreductase [Cohnella cellulosilytica]|uniref:SDR family NAD(P)-dependent oxidoreductase n=1 Tax=Cohnella cellulosilytica TaxID=986710 RepID=A0ABW2F3R5_9BACL